MSVLERPKDDGEKHDIKYNNMVRTKQVMRTEKAISDK